MEAFLERLKESLLSVEGVLYRTAVPNLKALEKMEEVKDKLQGMAKGIFCSVYSVDYYRMESALQLQILHVIVSAQTLLEAGSSLLNSSEYP